VGLTFLVWVGLRLSAQILIDGYIDRLFGSFIAFELDAGSVGEAVEDHHK